MIDLAAPTRPTRRRLLLALSFAACGVALLLSVSAWLVARTAPGAAPAGRTPLTVRIEASDAGSVPEPLIADSLIADSPIEDAADPEAPPRRAAATQPAPAGPSAPAEPSAAPPDEPQPSANWHAMAERVAAVTVDEHVRQEAMKTALWRASGSVMFRPEDGPELRSEEPILAGFAFKPEIRVLGIGLNIGSCFFGVPIAGVPVEQRSVAITLFVCAEKS